MSGKQKVYSCITQGETWDWPFYYETEAGTPESLAGATVEINIAVVGGESLLTESLTLGAGLTVIDLAGGHFAPSEDTAIWPDGEVEIDVRISKPGHKGFSNKLILEVEKPVPKPAVAP